MITTVITLLTLCVGIIFIFIISLENVSKDIEKIDKKYKNEMEVINYRFNTVYDHENTLLEKRISKLEKEILQLKSGDNSKFY